MKIIDLNRDGGIGANSLYCQIGDFHLVIDSGLHPKRAGRLATPDLRPLEGVKLDLIIITHCHLDHIGSLPVLMRSQPDVPVILTHASRMLIDRMLHNSVNVMVRERAEKNILEYPLFTHDEIERLLPRLHAHQFNLPKKFAGAKDEIEFTFHPAGHVTGATGVEIHHKNRRIFFTGDVLFEVQRTLAPAMFPTAKFDTLVMETTRGRPSAHVATPARRSSSGSSRPSMPRWRGADRSSSPCLLLAVCRRSLPCCTTPRSSIA